nr:unnamed protein product [Callosobruchus chinensis]
MHRVRQRFLSIPHPGRPQDPPHGRVSPQVPSVQQVLQPAVQPEDPSAHPHGHQALQLLGMRKGVQAELRPAQAQPDPQPGHQRVIARGKWDNRGGGTGVQHRQFDEQSGCHCSRQQIALDREDYVFSGAHCRKQCFNVV